jgi:hypothetical protein
VVSEDAWALLKEVWLMQVVREVARKRAKAAKAAAARTAAGVLEEAGAAGDDGEQQTHSRTVPSSKLVLAQLQVAYNAWWKAAIKRCCTLGDC